MISPAQQALWANDIARQCLLEAGDDVEAGLAAAEYILATQPMPEEFVLSTDAQGHEHKGKGEGGGQFVSKGKGGGTVSSSDKKKIQKEIDSAKKMMTYYQVGSDNWIRHKNKVETLEGVLKSAKFTIKKHLKTKNKGQIIHHGTGHDFDQPEIGSYWSSNKEASRVYLYNEDGYIHTGRLHQNAVVSDLGTGGWNHPLVKEFLDKTGNSHLNYPHFVELVEGREFREFLISKGYDAVTFEEESAETGSTNNIRHNSIVPLVPGAVEWIGKESTKGRQKDTIPPTDVKGRQSLSIDAFFSYDIHNRRAQGVLNRSLQAAKGLSAAARKDLELALKRGNRDSGEAIIKFIDKYRLQLAKLLTATQIASVLEGAREVAADVPTLAIFAGAVPPPPSLEPKEALALVEKLEGLAGDERALAIYRLPTNQQTYAQQALAAKEAGGFDAPPPFAPPAPPANAPESVHFPTIDEAVKQLAEKNVMTRERFDALDAAAKAKSFAVAGVDAEETLTKIRDTLAENVKTGADYGTFRKEVLSAVDEGTFMSEGHLETIFRTNVQSAFSDGQMTVLQHPLVRSGFPYSAYDAIHDDRVRHNHLALEKLGIDGTNIYRNDDPVFQTFRPPWDYNDRCSWTPMTVRQASEAGVEEAIKWLETGVEPAEKAFVPMPDFAPPEGFRRAVSSAPLSIRLSLQPMAAFATDEQGHEHRGKGEGGGQFTGSGKGDAPKKGGKFRALLALRHLVPGPVRRKVGAFVAKTYAKLESKYGRPGAIACLTGMVLLSPTPIPGSSLIPIALAEAVKRLRRQFAGQAAVAMSHVDALDPETLAGAIREELAALYAEVGEEPPPLDDGELAEVAKTLIEKYPAQSPEAALAVDTKGHEHKGKGSPEGGQFTSKGDGGGSSGKDAKAKPGKAKPKLSKEEREKASAQRFEELMASKSPKDAEAFRRAKADGVAIPPAWTEVTYHGKDENILAEGRDAKGRKQRAENPDYRQNVSNENNARIAKTLAPRIGVIRDRLRIDAEAGNEEAKVLYLITLTGFRIGGKGDGKAKVQAFGASTLRGEHVHVDGNTVTFNFAGKKGVKQEHAITDPVIAAMFRDAKPGQPIFRTNDLKVRGAWQERYGGTKVHDIRHVVATEIAAQELSKRIPPPPKNKKERDKVIKEVAAVSGEKLGNNPAQALGTYIDPKLWDKVKAVS